mmetsp:Transcript_86295/g.200653  ORF Transcript_86295/g.200653 Transcript_86295/m.200653 type:complete len:372 (-) Transcript_86295:88-1203(-)
MGAARSWSSFLLGCFFLSITTAKPLPKLMRAATVTGPNSQWKMCKLGSVTPLNCSAELHRYIVSLVSTPTAHLGTAVVKVIATSVNPHDWKASMSPGKGYMGVDFAGTVVSAHPSCGFIYGERVWGLRGLVGDGSFAEYIEKDCGTISRIPSKLSFIEAGAMPTVALTGRQAFKYTGIPWHNSPTVLVLGGAGGTGHVGIQLAKAYGAGKVITTCSRKNFKFVKKLGADEAIDYNEQNWWEVVKPGSVNIIYDCISLPGTGEHAYKILPEGGHFLTLSQESTASRATMAAHPKVQQHFFVVSKVTKQDWNDINNFIEWGKLRVSIEHTYEGLEQVKEAYGYSMRGHTRGKIAIRIANETTPKSFLHKGGAK